MNNKKQIGLYLLLFLVVALVGYSKLHPKYSRQQVFKCPEAYGENEFSLYVDDAAKWLAETKAENPNMTDDQLLEVRTQFLTDKDCKGRGGKAK